jgi:outer membrane protein OmpA-like peptidoglycan-associated protein
MIKRAKSSVTASIFTKLETAKPDSDEVDIAAATSLAVRKLQSDQIEGRENILVFYASGVSTSGLIDMTDTPIFKLDAEASATNLAETMNLDMTGIKVVWYGCGDVAGTVQNSLSDNEKQIEKEFYNTWLTSMGADEVSFKEVFPDGKEEYSFEHQVSAMKTEGTQSVLSAKIVAFEEVEETEMEEVFADGDIISFDEKSVAFLPDSTELADSNAAMEAFSYVISYMDEHPEFTLMICGTTTSAGEPASCMDFSEKRAQTIRTLLVEETGIDESRIITLGCGYSSCLYINDRDAAGNLNEEKAPLNRSVKLVDYNSEIASEIIESLDAQ